MQRNAGPKGVYSLQQRERMEDPFSLSHYTQHLRESLAS